MSAPRHGVIGLWAYLRSGPATLVYLFSLLVGQLTLSTVGDRLGQRLLVDESTNLSNMGRVPVQVLVGSAFWIDADTAATCAILAALVVTMVPVERWLGTGRWLVVVVCGHIGATLLTLAAAITLQDLGRLDPAVVHASDVGVSYVVLAGLGVAVHRIADGRIRLAVAVLVVLVVAAPLAVDQGLTDLGHLCSLALGLAAWPLTPTARVRRAGAAQRADGPAPLSPPRQWGRRPARRRPGRAGDVPTAPRQRSGTPAGSPSR